MENVSYKTNNLKHEHQCHT